MRREHRFLYSSLAVSIGVVALLLPAMARGQQRPSAGTDTTDHMQFACLDDGLSRKGSTGFGCQRLATYKVANFLDTPLYWHIMKLPTGSRAVPPAPPDKEQKAFVVEAAGQRWLYSFGSKDAIPAQGEHVISIGPLPLRAANSYQIDAYFVVMPPGVHSSIHTHPGPEAWYLIEGTQCLDTPQGAKQLASGEGAVVSPDTPMRLHNSGPATRRALFIVIHDPALPWVSAAHWTPTGGCER